MEWKAVIVKGTWILIGIVPGADRSDYIRNAEHDFKDDYDYWTKLGYDLDVITTAEYWEGKKQCAAMGAALAG